MDSSKPLIQTVKRKNPLGVTGFSRPMGMKPTSAFAPASVSLASKKSDPVAKPDSAGVKGKSSEALKVGSYFRGMSKVRMNHE